MRRRHKGKPHSRNNLNYIKIAVGIFCVISLLFVGYLIYQDNLEQKQKSEEIAAINKQLIHDSQVESERIDAITASLPKIICWGDSLTAGAGGNGVVYPDVLSNLLNVKVLNFGVGGEGAAQIAYRQGAMPIYFAPVMIPADLTPVEVNVINKDGNNAGIVRQNNTGVNPCKVGDIVGNLTFDKEAEKYYFTRLKSGEAVEFKENTQLITSAMQDMSNNDILVIYSGTNNQPNGTTIRNVIDIQRQMIEYAGADDYIIVGMTSKYYMPDIENVNIALRNEYGDKFLDFRTYLLEYGLKEADITPTDQDLEDIKNGEIPTSLRADNVHGNGYYYKMLGELLADKVIELGYLTSDQLEVLGVSK